MCLSKYIYLNICDRDEIFLSKLEKYIDSVEGSPFLIKTHTSLNTVKDWGKGIGLVDESLMSEQFKEKKTGVFVLHSGSVVTVDGCEEMVYKYQPADRIYDFLISKLDRFSGIQEYNRLDVAQNKAVLHGVYSPDPEICTAKMADYLMKTGRISERAAYIDYSSFSSFSDQGEGLSELIYYARENPMKLKVNLKNYIEDTGSICRVKEAGCFYDFNKLTNDVWEKVSLYLHKFLECRNIIFNFRELPGDIELLTMMDVVWVPVRDTEESGLLFNRFINVLKAMGRHDLVQKVKAVERYEL